MSLQNKYGRAVGWKRQMALALSVAALGLASWSGRAQTSAPAAATPAAVVPTAAAPAQASATAGGTKVHGTITDPDGELIPGAAVQLTSPKGTVVKTTSGSDGTYTLSIAPGTYTVLVTMPGFAAYTAQGVRIPAVASTTLDAKMQVGTQEQVVTVSADSIQLSVDPENNQSATILSGKDLDALSDDPDELSSELTALAGPSAGPNGGQIYVDGFTGGQLPPKSSIREIRINQNPFSAQYDRLGFGRIEIFTKPGTDKFHGNIQANGNPSQFNSINPLETGFQPPYHTLFLFGNLTGPITKLSSFNLGGTYREIQDDEFTNVPIPVVPGTTTLCTTPGSGACTGTYQYQQQTYYPQTRAEVNPRIDLQLGPKNVLTTRYQYVNNSSTNQLPNTLDLPTVADNTNSLSNILQMSDNMNISSRLINEIHFEYEREHTSQKPLSSAPNVSVPGTFVAGGSSAQSVTDHQDHFEIQNYTSLQLKKNFIRFGGRLRSTREAQNTQNNTNGSFQYSSIDYTCVVAPAQTCPTPTSGIGTAVDHSYVTGTPQQFSLTQVKNPKIGDTFVDLGLYAETDWKATKNMTISYGFRYETQNHLNDHHDFAPRASLNYGLFTGKGSPKTVVRAGFGMFYDRFAQGSILTLQQENGTNETIFTVKTPPASCNPNAAAGLTGSAAQAALLVACPASSATQTTYQAANNLRTPYITQFALGADQVLGKTATISVNYLHSQGAHQLASQNINYSTYPATYHPAVGPEYQYFSEGVFKQNQLILNGRYAFSKRISLFGYVSLNSAKGDTSGAGSFITTPGNIAADYGRTTFDVKARYFISGSFSLPYFIQLSPFMIGQSGNPYNVTTGTDNNGDTIFNDRPLLVAPNTTNSNTVGTIAGCGTFAEPGGSAINGAPIVPINYCTGPSQFVFNLRVTKTFGFGNKTGAPARGGDLGPGGGGGGSALGMAGGGGAPRGGGGAPGGGGGGRGGGGASTGKKYNFTVGAQFQNLFNNLDLATPNGSLNSPNFGHSTQVTGGAYTTQSALRRIQVQAAFTF